MTNLGIQFGGYYKDPDRVVFAEVDSFEVKDGKNYVLFSLWDPKSPGWQSGAGLEVDQFTAQYTKQVTEQEVLNSKPKLKIRITATYEYEVDPTSLKTQQAYKTGDPDEIFAIDRENAWELLYEQMTEGDDVVLKIERVTE